MSSSDDRTNGPVASKLVKCSPPGHNEPGCTVSNRNDLPVPPGHDSRIAYLRPGSNDDGACRVWRGRAGTVRVNAAPLAELRAGVADATAFAANPAGRRRAAVGGGATVLLRDAFFLHGFLPFGQRAAVAGDKPRSPATDPAATPPSARRERTTVMSRVRWSNVDDSMMILHGEGCVASRCTGPDSASQWDHN